MATSFYRLTTHRDITIEELRTTTLEGRKYIHLFSLQELVQIFPSYRIADGYIKFRDIDVLIHIENYTKCFENGPFVVDINYNNNYTIDTVGNNQICIFRSIDNGIFEYNSGHYIYNWMIKKILRLNSTIIYRAKLELIVLTELEKIDFTKVYDDPFNGYFSIKK